MPNQPARRRGVADQPFLPANLKRHTAAAFRDLVCAEWAGMYLLEIASGRDPRVTLAHLDPATAKPRRSGKPPEGTPTMATQPSLDQSLSALREYMLRRDGAPAQQIHLEAVLAASMHTEHAVSARVLETLTPEAAEGLLAYVQRALRRGASDEDSLLLSGGDILDVPANATPDAPERAESDDSILGSTQTAGLEPAKP